MTPLSEPLTINQRVCEQQKHLLKVKIKQLERKVSNLVSENSRLNAQVFKLQKKIVYERYD